MKKIISLLLLLSFTIKAQDVKIGKQTWTTKNLDVSKFRNGEAIPLAKTNAEWALAGQNGQPAWCYYNNDPANGTTYGKLYNWYAVSDPRGLAPNGYHIPTDKEWTTLTTYLGGDWSASPKMKSSSGWKSGNNTSGFNALPCGFRHIDGNFESNVGPGGTIIFEGSDAEWWGSSEASTRTAGSIRLDNFGNNSNRSNRTKSLGFSVRCIKDCSNDYPPNIELNKRNAEEKKGEAIYNWWLEWGEEEEKKDIEQSNHKTKSKRREQSKRPNWECTHCHKVSYQDQKPDHPWGDVIECQEAYDRFNHCCGWHAWVEIN